MNELIVSKPYKPLWAAILAMVGFAGAARPVSALDFDKDCHFDSFGSYLHDVGRAFEGFVDPRVVQRA